MGKRGKCIVCGQKFQAKKKGYKRYSLKSHLGPSFETDVAAALAKTLPDFRPKLQEEGHVCDSCYRLLRTTLRRREELLKTEIEWTNRISQGPYGKQLLKSRSRTRTQQRKTKKSKQSDVAIKSKRKLGEVQNLMSDSASGDGEQVGRKRLKLAPTVAVLCKNGGHNNFMKRAIAYLLQYKYHKAISTIIAGSERAKRSFRGVLEKEVRKEVFWYCKSAKGISQAPQRDKLFSWQRTLNCMESKMPVFYSACYAALNMRKGVDLVQLRGADKKQLIRPRLGLMMLLPLFTRRERKFGSVMHILALLLRRFGSHEKMAGILHHLGVCQRSTATLNRKADGLEEEECEGLLTWAVHNLAEMKEPSHPGRSQKKGQVAKAQMPPDDGVLSDEPRESEDEGESEDENMLLGGSNFDDDDDDEAENEDGEINCGHDEEDDDDDSLLNMLSSDESACWEEQEDGEELKEEEEAKEEEKESGSKEELVEVDGCVQDIETAEVEVHMLVDVYKALAERT